MRSGYVRNVTKSDKKRRTIIIAALGVLLVLALLQANSPKAPSSFYSGQTQEIQTVGDAPGVSSPWAPSVTETESRYPAQASLRGDPKTRNHSTYDAVINQFAVEENPRYRPRENFTFCNTFVWDVTRAMGAEIPYWVGQDGAAKELWVTDRGWSVRPPAYSMSANSMNRWLNQCTSPKCAWHEVSAEEAQDLANLGHPAVVSATEPNGEGHIGIVRPGGMSNGPAMAQAGITNVNYAYVYDFFPREGTQFFINDEGTVVD